MIRWVVLALVACSGGTESPPETRASATTEPATEPMRELAEPVSPWPRDLVNLSASTEHFQNRESCENELRERVPVEVAEALSDLGYDAVIRDVCIGLDAAKRSDPSLCDELQVRAAQDGCRRRTAILSGVAEHCPGSHTLPGRDPICLAYAARDPNLCTGAPRSDRRSCRAVLANDSARCADALCRARVERYGVIVETSRRHEPPDTHATLTIRRHEMVDEVHEYETAAERGVFLRAGDASHRVELELGERFRNEPRFSFEASLGGSPTVHRATLAIGANERVLAEATLTFEAERERGARLKGTLEGRFGSGSNRTDITLEFETWIRDLEPISPSTPPPGT